MLADETKPEAEAAASDSGRLPRVSVIIPHYRDLGGLELCLAALERQTYPRELTEIIVADNASPEGPEAVSAAIAGRARLVVVTERGAGPARNGAVAASSGAVLAFIDSDCVAEPEWLAEGVKALQQSDVIGGHVRVLVDDPKRMSSAEAFEAVFAFDFKTYIERKGFSGAGNLFCSRGVFDKVGGFRPAVSEDVDWSRRATAAGYRLSYAPKAVVGHPARRTWAELQAKWRRINIETYNLAAAAGSSRMSWLARNLLLPLSALAHTPRVLASPELKTLRNKLNALAMLYRLRNWRLLHALQLLRNAP